MAGREMSTTETSRAYILRRRGGGIANLSDVNFENGELTIEQLISKQIYTINGTHQIGIATATEVGLSADRYPIRAIILAAPGNSPRKGRVAETVVGYWKVTTADGVNIRFQRKPFQNDLVILRCMSWIRDFNELLWADYEEGAAANWVEATLPATDADQNNFLTIGNMVNPTDAQKAQFVASFDSIRTLCKAANTYPYFKVDNNAFIKAIPHGIAYDPIGAMTGDTLATYEVALTCRLNFNAMKARNPNMTDGFIAQCSLAIANMFRFGLYESHASHEYHTAVFIPKVNVPKVFVLTEWSTPFNTTAPTSPVLNSEVDISKMKFKEQMTEIGSLFIYMAGLMHYMFNHTTGGSTVSGPLFSTLVMYQHVVTGTAGEALELVTNACYEALHPVNKRAIANLFFRTSKVTSYGRAGGAPRAKKMNLDSFVEIRTNPYPAGSHKAFLCIAGLKKVVESGLAPFLPWADSINNCIQTCSDVLSRGAAAHIGAHYYTGEGCISQPASLDDYLPEIAHFVQVFCRGDSLGMSPHLSVDVAARCNMNWKNMLKELRAKDVSSTNVDTVRKFLATSGTVAFSFDPEVETTWSAAVDNARVAKGAIDQILKR